MLLARLTVRLAPGPKQWAALRGQALADGIMDAAILRRSEGRRPANLQSEEWKTRQWKKVEQALECLDFRFGSEDWRKSWTNLVAWQKKSLPRPSMMARARRN